jgi:hypothetical protein
VNRVDYDARYARPNGQTAEEIAADAAAERGEKLEWCPECRSQHTKSFGDAFHGRILRVVR